MSISILIHVFISMYPHLFLIEHECNIALCCDLHYQSKVWTLKYLSFLKKNILRL